VVVDHPFLFGIITIYIFVSEGNFFIFEIIFNINQFIMKRKLPKQLTAYTTAASSIIIGNVAFGQNIQYTDVNPDVILNKTSGPFEMDFNNDTGVDMTFQVASFNGSGSSTYNGIPFTFVYNGSQAGVQPGPLGGVQGQIIGSSSTFGVSALNSGDGIAAANNFSSQQAALGVKGTVTIPAFSFNYNINQGEFLGVSEKFMGMKFSAGGNIHYGWVRLSLDTSNVDSLILTIHDYAYNGDPDQSINAGDMPGASIIALQALENKVTFNQYLEGITANVTPDLIGSELVIYDLGGKKIQTAQVDDIQAKISYTGMQTGIYFVSLETNQGKLSKKVYVK
jgi:hypothetical protein